MPTHASSLALMLPDMTKDKMNNFSLDTQMGELSPRLKSLEKQLNGAISELYAIGDLSSNQAGIRASQVSMLSADDIDLSEVNLVSLRYRMRLLRRWRNGSVQCSGNDLDELSSFLDHARLYIIEIHLDAMKHKLEEVESLLCQNDVSDDAALTQRLQLDLEVAKLCQCSEEMRSGEDLVEDNVLAETEIRCKMLMGELERLRSRLLEKSGREDPVNAPPIRLGESFQRRRSKGTRRGKVKPKKIEEHPHVNRILKNVGRIQRMIHVLHRGGHVAEITEKGDGSCAKHDIDVLDRQLQRLQRWEQLADACASEDLEQLEHVVSAIQKHIRPGIDLDFPIKMLNLVDSSMEHTDSSQHTNGYHGDTEAEDGIISERLI